jgi:CSLREA domain-containing protein
MGGHRRDRCVARPARPRATAAVALAFLLALVPQALAATFEPLPHPDGLFSEPVATSGTGRFVLVNVYEESTSGHVPASYRWDNGEVEPIPCIFASDMSDDGNIITAQCQNQDGERHLWVDGALMLLPAGYRNAILTAVSGDGLTVFGVRNYEYCQTPELCHDPFQAFRLASGVAQDLGFLPGDHASLVTGASYDGSVAAFLSHLQDISPSEEETGGPFKLDLNHAARWKASAQPQGSLLQLIPSAEHSFVNEVSSDGKTLVGDWYRWTEATGLVWLDILPGTTEARANGVSRDGAVIVGSYFTDAYPDGRASIWTQETGLQDLQDLLVDDLEVDLEGWELLSATDISTDASTIVGVGIDPDSGLVSGWRVQLVDDPIVVNVTGDEPNDPASKAADVCDVDLEEEDWQCTLRAAIELANERGGDRIIFDIPGEGVPTIEVVHFSDGPPGQSIDRGLPPFTSPIQLDATTQPGGWVEIAGPGHGFAYLAHGIAIDAGADGSEVRGLVVQGFAAGDVAVIANECLIAGNRIGTDVTGTEARSTIATYLAGMAVRGDGNRLVDNVIAGAAWPAGEGGMQLVIRGNDNVLEGNRIGVGADGLAMPLPPPDSNEGYFGVVVLGDGNRIGGGAVVPEGNCESPCNIIAGFDVAVAISKARYVFDAVSSSGNEVSGNWIGLDADGTPAFLSVNGSTGIHDFSTSATGSVIEHNLVYADRDGIAGGNGAQVIGNEVFGRAEGFDPDNHFVNSALVSAFGAGGEFRENVVRSWSYRGIRVTGPGPTTIEQNEITDNPLGGIEVQGGSGHVIAENLIRDNGRLGIGIVNFDSDDPTAMLTGNRIYGNDIGIDLFPFTGEIIQGSWGDYFQNNGVTLNDSNDADAGPNDFQNFPKILSATAVDGHVQLEGFIETPALTSATHRIEVFGGSECHSRSYRGGIRYGQGEQYLGFHEATSGLTDLDFDLDVPLPGGEESASIAYVSLTATRVDRGTTSEFGPCIPIASTDDVASADVPANASGPVLDDRGVAISVASSAALRRVASAPNVGAGKLFVTRYEREPDGRVFADEVATGPGGTDVEPNALAARYWYIADRGLTAAGGATSPRTFDICLDPTGVVSPGALPTTVVVHRNEETDGAWVPHDTTSTQHGDAVYLCVSGLTELGEFAFGTESTVLCGDLNGSGTITASDALLILRASVGGNQCAKEPCVCDVNASGTISASDALATLRSAVTQTALDSCGC